MFTQQTLRRRATAKVFDRGQELWASGAVKQLTRSAPTRFGARVRGTHRYHTAAWLAAGDVEFSCDCAYELDGICKHAVALGLAVLDTYGPLEADPTALPPAAGAAPDPDRAALAAAWASRPDPDKLRFLEQALTKSDDLARQFLGFGGRAAPAPGPDLLEGLAERLSETLSMLEFGEDFWETSNAYHAYDEGDGLQNAAGELLTETLAPFVAELLRLARVGQLTRALRYWATASAAIYQVEEPASDEYGLFGDFGTDVLRQWQQDLDGAGWPAVLTGIIVPPTELKAALRWLGTYLADPPAAWPDFELSWRPLLLTLAADPPAAKLLPAALKSAKLSPETQARLRLRLAQTQADDPTWLAAAAELLTLDAAVAQQLLNYHTSQADRPALLRTATTAFATWPDRFADYVLRTFPAPEAPDLYRAALRYRALANYSSSDFEQLRPLLSAAERQGFVKAAVKQARDGRQGVAFAADLLAREGETDALRRFVLGLEWPLISPPYHADLALLRLAQADPTPLMLELETRLPAYLRGRASVKRGHVLYESIGRWLVAVRGAAPRLEEPVLRLAQELRVEFPTLHGLRDVLRREGFLPGEGVVKSGRRGGR